VIVLNGERCELADGATVVAALERLGVETGTRGVAVAVDGEVVPRGAWRSFALADGARVEVLKPIQGG
jgi:sulfur carrier protein